MVNVLGNTSHRTEPALTLVQIQLPEICRFPHSWAVQGAACLAAAVSSLLWPSPTDALIDLKVRYRLASLVTIRQWLHAFHTFSDRRMGLVPQRRPAS